jgi:phytoene dehydrogenase-like protein
VVVGAGVAGLACALELQRAGRDVVVVEREPEVGGRVRSRVVAGYTVDRGFQVLFTAYPTLRRLLDLDALGLRPFRAAARVVTARGASLVGDAVRDPSLLVPTLAARALSPADKLRLLALRRLATSLSVDDCFADPYDAVTARAYLRARGVSERAVARFFAPFYGGILLDPSLSASASVLLFTLKMLAEGDTALPAAGMGAITRQLAARLRPGTVRTAADVASVATSAGGVRGVTLADGETLDAAHVVLGTEAPAARRLAATAGVDLTVPGPGLGSVTVYLAAGEPVLPGRAIWLNAVDAPAPDGGPRVLHAVTLSDVAPEYASPGAEHGPHLVAATAAGVHDAHDDEALVRAARRDLAAMRRAAGLEGAPALIPVAVERVPYSQFAQPPGARRRRTPAATPLAGLWRASETAHSSSLEGAARGGVAAAAAVAAAGAAAVTAG